VSNALRKLNERYALLIIGVGQTDHD